MPKIISEERKSEILKCYGYFKKKDKPEVDQGIIEAQLADIFGNIPKRYKIDEILKGQGHEVLRLPPCHCQFNPIVKWHGDFVRTFVIKLKPRKQHPRIELREYDKKLDVSGQWSFKTLNGWIQRSTTNPEDWEGSLTYSIHNIV